MDFGVIREPASQEKGFQIRVGTKEAEVEKKKSLSRAPVSVKTQTLRTPTYEAPGYFKSILHKQSHHPYQRPELASENRDCFFLHPSIVLHIIIFAEWQDLNSEALRTSSLSFLPRLGH